MVCKGIDIRELIKAYEACGGAVRFLGLHGYVFEGALISVSLWD
jgi:hypothetical protein